MAAILSLKPPHWGEWILIFIFFTWTYRMVWMTLFRITHPPITLQSVPTGIKLQKISVIVPARNEEENIVNCLEHLSRQSHPHYEIIVVNDRSTDRTAALLETFKQNSPVPFKIVSITSLTAGWTGKNHAMARGAEAAEGPWFLFTDADTTHNPSSLEASLRYAQVHHIDFLTLAPEVECRSFWEHMVQPVAIGSLAVWFNSDQVNDPKSSAVLANGQFILVKKQVYEAIGGNASVKDQVIEDVELAKKIKTAGYSMKFLNGTRLYSTRMYHSLKEILNGWTRIFTYLMNKNIYAVVEKIGFFLFFSLLPFAVLFFEIGLAAHASALYNPALTWLSLGVCLWISIVRAAGNKILKANPWAGCLHPVGSLVMLWILLKCLGRICFNRPSLWRGDSYR